MFTNGDAVESDQYRFKKGNSAVNSFDTGKVKTNDAQQKLGIDFEYYKDSTKDPREATGTIFYRQDEKTYDENVDFYIGFGGAKK